MKVLCDQLANTASQLGGPFIAGSKLSVADLSFYFALYKMVADGQFDYVPANYMDKFPSLKAVAEKIEAHPDFVAHGSKCNASG